MDIIGKYLRLRRELVKPTALPEQTLHRQRVARDTVQAGAELEGGRPDVAPFVETMPWSDTLGVTYEYQPGLA